MHELRPFELSRSTARRTYEPPPLRCDANGLFVVGSLGVGGISTETFKLWRERTQTLSHIGVFEQSIKTLSRSGETPNQLRGAEVSPSLFRMLRGPDPHALPCPGHASTSDLSLLTPIQRRGICSR